MKMMMQMAAQGDLLIRRIADDAIPAGAEEVAPTGGRHVVAHSETGHHHYLDATGVTLLRVPGDPMVAYLVIASDAEHEYARLEHARPWDTHETIAIPPGTYELRRQREYTPEGWRRVED